MQEFLMSKLFSKFYVKSISVMANHIIGLLNGGRYEEVKGALMLARKLIKLPAELNKSDNKTSADGQQLSKQPIQNINDKVPAIIFPP